MKTTGLILTTIFLTSCSFILAKIYGYRELDEFSIQDHQVFVGDYLGQLNVDTIIASKVSFEKWSDLQTNYLSEKGLSQPIQMIYLLKDSLISFQANCYAKGKIGSLDWNYDGRFNQFPPSSAVHPDYIIFGKESLLGAYPGVRMDEDKYTVLIFWTNMLSEISKDAIDITLANLRAFHKTDSAMIYLINIDKAFIGIR